VKRLVKLSLISETDKRRIAYELISRIDNPYYKRSDKSIITYKDPKLKFRAKECNVFEAYETPPSPVEMSSLPPVDQQEVVPADSTRVRALAKLTSISAEDKESIVSELKRGIENPYYDLRGDMLAYKDPKLKKRAKT
jgi:hypothetical protein